MKNSKNTYVAKKQFNTFGEALSMLDKFMGYDPATMERVVDQGEHGRSVLYLFGELGILWVVTRLGPPGTKAWEVCRGAIYLKYPGEFTPVDLLHAHFEEFATHRIAIETRVHDKWQAFLGEKGRALLTRSDDETACNEDLDHLSHLFLDFAESLEGEERQVFLAPFLQGIERIHNARAVLAETLGEDVDSGEA